MVSKQLIRQCDPLCFCLKLLAKIADNSTVETGSENSESRVPCLEPTVKGKSREVVVVILTLLSPPRPLLMVPRGGRPPVPCHETYRTVYVVHV